MLVGRVLVDGLDHPEGVAFDHKSGVLYAGGEDGQVYAIDPEAGTFEEVARTPGFNLGLAVDGRGRLVICDSADAAIWVLEEGRLRRLMDRAGDRKLILPNFPAFGPEGNLYFSDSGRWKEHNGAVIRVTPDGEATVIDTTLNRFTNGCAVTPDGSELWVMQSLGPVARMDLRGGGTPEVVVELPGTVPDGIAFTEEGGAVLTCYRPDRIYYLNPEGALEILAEDPEGTLMAAPTNVCFLGGDRRTMVSANLGRWHLTAFETDLVGVVPHAPETWAVDVL
jgi:gluconolactonase